MEVDLHSGAPEGATWIERPSPGPATQEARFCVLSRGDRVWGRCRFPSHGSAPSGGVILLPPDGDSESPFVDDALERWGSWVTVASADLPLCGRRRSEKLSPAVEERDSVLRARLLPDLTAQLEQDLVSLARLLAASRDVHSERTALVALGMSADLLLPSLQGGGWPSVAVVAPPPEGVDLPARVHAVPMPTRAETVGWLDDVEAYLRDALTRAGS